MPRGMVCIQCGADMTDSLPVRDEHTGVLIRVCRGGGKQPGGGAALGCGRGYPLSTGSPGRAYRRTRAVVLGVLTVAVKVLFTFWFVWGSMMAWHDAFGSRTSLTALPSLTAANIAPIVLMAIVLGTWIGAGTGHLGRFGGWVAVVVCSLLVLLLDGVAWALAFAPGNTTNAPGVGDAAADFGRLGTDRIAESLLPLVCGLIAAVPALPIGWGLAWLYRIIMSQRRNAFRRRRRHERSGA